MFWKRDLFNLTLVMRIRISGILDCDSKGSQDFLLHSCCLGSWYVQVHLSSFKGQIKVPHLLSGKLSQGKVPIIIPFQKRCPIWHPGGWSHVLREPLKWHHSCLVEASFTVNERQVNIKSGSQNIPVVSLHSECLTSRTKEADAPPLKEERGSVTLHTVTQ